MAQQHTPMAETSGPCRPSLRFAIIVGAPLIQVT